MLRGSDSQILGGSDTQAHMLHAVQTPRDAESQIIV